MELIFEKERAIVYDNFIYNWMPGYELYMRLLPSILKSELQTIEHVLSVGCGTGNELLTISNSYPNSKIIGIDPSEEMIKIAKNKTHNFTNIDIFKTTIDKLKTEVKFDAITLTLVLHFIPDEEKIDFLKTISHNLKPKGCLVLCDVYGSEEKINQQIKILKSIVEPTTTEKELNRRIEHIKNNFHYINKRRLNELLKESGFNLPNKFFQTTIYNAWLITKK